MKMGLKSIIIYSLFYLIAITNINAQVVDCLDKKEWQKELIYDVGDEVLRFGILYEAKWWSLGQSPHTNYGELEVWSKIGECNIGDAKIQFENPKNNDEIDVSLTKEIHLRISIDDSIKNSSLRVYIDNEEIRLFLKNGLWEGGWIPKKNGHYRALAEATRKTGEVFTSQIEFDVIGIVEEEILITYFFPLKNGVYEPNRILYFQVEVFDKNFMRDVISVHFEIDRTIKEAIYESKLNRWVANISTPPIPGQYRIRTVAKDNSGNKVVKDMFIEVKEKVTNKPPEVSFDKLEDGYVVITDSSGLIPINFKVMDPDENLALVEIYIDDILEESFKIDGNGSYNHKWRPFTTGWHKIRIKAEDNEEAISFKEIEIKVISRIECYYTWSSFRYYEGGDVVSYDGKNYRAKWWSHDENPESFSGSWDPWELIGDCFKGGNSKSFFKETGIGIQMKKITMYPMPANDKIFFENMNNRLVTVQIKNLMGNTLISKSVNQNNNTINLDLLPSGTYIMLLGSGNFEEKRIFIKQ